MTNDKDRTKGYSFLAKACKSHNEYDGGRNNNSVFQLIARRMEYPLITLEHEVVPSEILQGPFTHHCAVFVLYSFRTFMRRYFLAKQT